MLLSVEAESLLDVNDVCEAQRMTRYRSGEKEDSKGKPHLKMIFIMIWMKPWSRNKKKVKIFNYFTYLKMNKVTSSIGARGKGGVV